MKVLATRSVPLAGTLETVTSAFADQSAKPKTIAELVPARVKLRTLTVSVAVDIDVFPTPP